MPRVNRDLQRRMAARRERERRRPSTERQYRFTAPEPELEVEDAPAENGSATEVSEPRSSTDRRSARATSVATEARPSRTAKPFSAYREEYAYVASDLRRVGVVVGSLLVVLIVLYFVLPLLAR